MNKPNSRFFRNMNDRRDGNMDGGGGHRGGGGYNNNYRNSNSYGDNGERVYHRNHRYEQEEPEWFTGGPSSQLDTIELHGFDGHAPEEKNEGETTGGRKFKRINEVEKEMKQQERAAKEESNAEQTNDKRRRGEGADAERGSNSTKENRKNSATDTRKSKEQFPSSFGQQQQQHHDDEEEESALRKMVPTGSSPIKKPGGGQMDMRHFEDFLRLEDMLSVSF